MPTFVIVKDKQIINRFSGANKQLLIEAIENIKSYDSSLEVVNTDVNQGNDFNQSGEFNQSSQFNQSGNFNESGDFNQSPNDLSQQSQFQDTNNSDFNLGLGMDTLDADNYYYLNN